MAKSTEQDSAIWSRRSVAETVDLYREWSKTYEHDIADLGYATPARLATALAGLCDLQAPVLDFGCGTGLSGVALAAVGFSTIDGTDITPEMLAQAADKAVYRRLFPSDSNSDGNSDESGAYAAIVAAGVVSLGAAPPEVLGALYRKLAAGGLLGFSYNDPTLADAAYMAALEDLISAGALVRFREHGPHLPGKGMGADIIILQKA